MFFFRVQNRWKILCWGSRYFLEHFLMLDISLLSSFSARKIIIILCFSIFGEESFSKNSRITLRALLSVTRLTAHWRPYVVFYGLETFRAVKKFRNLKIHFSKKCGEMTRTSKYNIRNVQSIDFEMKKESSASIPVETRLTVSASVKFIWGTGLLTFGLRCFCWRGVHVGFFTHGSRVS